MAVFPGEVGAGLRRRSVTRPPATRPRASPAARGRRQESCILTPLDISTLGVSRALGRRQHQQGVFISVPR